MQMMTKGDFVLLTKQCIGRLKPGLLCVFASVLLFFGQNFVAFGENSAKGTFLQQDNNTLQSIPASPYQFAKVHLPIESAPTSDDRETYSENEQEDDFDHDWCLVVELPTLFSIPDITIIDNSTTHLSSFIQYPSPVPFFVLYHSWKNDLA